MSQSSVVTHRRINWLRFTSRSLALAWGVFWSWFGAASGISEGIGLLGTIVHTALPGLIFLVSALIPWWLPRTGGVILIVEGVIVAIAYPIMFGQFPLATIIFVLLTMSAPPLLSGILFLLEHHRINKGIDVPEIGT
jgi:hypothetical protein